MKKNHLPEEHPATLKDLASQPVTTERAHKSMLRQRVANRRKGEDIRLAQKVAGGETGAET